MKLNLINPLCVFDLETTGTQVTKDRIVQIAIIKLLPNGEKEEYNQLINPEIPIPDDIAAIHGITNDKVKVCHTFREKASEIAEEFLRSDYEFDLSNRKFIDVQNIFHKMEQRTLAAAYQFYCDKRIENAHDALYDTRATLEVFLAQLNRYEDLKNDVTFLSEFSRAGEFELVDLAGRLAKNKKGEVIYNFGKHNGKSIAEVMKIEPGYYGWMLDADFPLYTKKCLRIEMQRIKESSYISPDSMDDKLKQLKNKFNSK